MLSSALIVLVGLCTGAGEARALPTSLAATASVQSGELLMWRDDTTLARELSVTGGLLWRDQTPFAEQQPVLRLYRYNADELDGLGALDSHGGLSGPVRVVRRLVDGGFVWPSDDLLDVTAQAASLGVSPAAFVEARPTKFVQPTNIYALQIEGDVAATVLVVTTEALDEPNAPVFARFFVMSADGQTFAQTLVSNIHRDDLARAARLIAPTSLHG